MNSETIPPEIVAILEAARAHRAAGIGADCKHCGAAATWGTAHRDLMNGSHNAAVEAAFSGKLLLCEHCEKPLGRYIGFLYCPTHGWECGGALLKETRKSFPLEAGENLPRPLDNA